ncbi:hypothetical protein [Paenibacillus sp.]|uniref:hypothetical protein n=1 Tax=Paenibacillus sp. TaxID=58172 RepID=UPI00283A9943|nr:hypothetical protein [Paenibacillus sp.]
MDRKKIMLPPEEQEEYIITVDQRKGYAQSGWVTGTKVRRVSKWLSGNGCGVRQALFVLSDKPWGDYDVWEDHVRPVLGQMDLFDLIEFH